MTKNYFCSMIEWYGIIIIIQFKNHGVTKMDAILVFVVTVVFLFKNAGEGMDS